jgi:hypothetical protein
MNPHKFISRIVPKSVVLSCLVAASAYAGGTNYFFNGPTDPTTDGTLTVFRGGDTPTLAAEAGVWSAVDGSPFDPSITNADFSTNGYFSITSDLGHHSAILFNDFDNGLIVQAFTFDVDVRVGGGSANPADGFSISFARGNDPVILHADGTGFANSEDGSAVDAAEEGTTTGLAICFDAFSNAGGDPVAMTIRLDNTVVTNVLMPTLNGLSTDPTSLQTGIDSNSAGQGRLDLAWVHLRAQITTNGLLNVNYKGTALLTNFPVAYAPSAGRLILAGRTGGFFEFQDVDAIRIQTIAATSPGVGPAAAQGVTGFSVTISDSGAAVPDTNTLLVKLDGTTIITNGGNVSGGTVTISKAGAITTITYQQAAIFASGSTHTVEVAFSGSTFTGTVDSTRSFVVPTYATLPLGLRTPLGSGDSSKPGFRLQAYQIANTNAFPNGWVNSTQFAEQQIAGLINTNTQAGAGGANLVDLSGFTDNGWFDAPAVINFRGTSGGAVENPLNSANDSGSFVTTNGYADSPLPGLPGTITPTIDDDVVYQMVSFLEFPTAGLYTFGVQSDDGFKLALGDRTGPDIGVRVLAPASVAGPIDAVPDAIAYGQGFGGTLPTAPIIGRAVLCDPPWPTAMPNNAAALSNNIALIHRDPTGGVATHGIWAQNAGAIAIIVIDQDDAGSAGRLPGTWGGAAAVTVPVEMIEYKAGTNLYTVATTNANSPVILSIGDDSSLKLGEFSGGRGNGNPTLFNVNVTQAGVYPLRLLYENGGGDANAEFFTQDANGNRVLVNDLSGPNATNTARVKAFRARAITTGSAHLNNPTVSGGNVTVTWTGEGELEQSYSLSGPWTKSPFQGNPSIVPMNSFFPAVYFRVRQF